MPAMCQLTVQTQYAIAGVDCYCNKCIIIMHLQFEETKINSIFTSSDFYLSRIHTSQVVAQRLRWTAFHTGRKSSAFFRRMPWRKADWASQAHIDLLFCC